MAGPQTTNYRNLRQTPPPPVTQTVNTRGRESTVPVNPNQTTNYQNVNDRGRAPVLTNPNENKWGVDVSTPPGATNEPNVMPRVTDPSVLPPPAPRPKEVVSLPPMETPVVMSTAPVRETARIDVKQDSDVNLQPRTEFGMTYEERVRRALAAPGEAVSDFGRTYDENLRRGLESGRAPGTEDLNAQLQRENSLTQSRISRQTHENLLRQGIQPGTAQYNRAMAEANAGIESANMNRSMATNERIRSNYAEMLQQAKAREGETFNREQNALGLAKGLETEARAADLQKKTENQSLINSVQDPRAKALLQGVLNQGGDVRDAYNQMFGISEGTITGEGAGKLAEDFRSSSPAQANIEGMRDEVRAATPRIPGESEADYSARLEARVAEMAERQLNAKYKPLDTIVEKETEKSISDKLNTMNKEQYLTGDEFQEARKAGIIKNFTNTTIPRGARAVNEFLKDNPSGIVAIDGKQWKVLEGTDPRTDRTDWTQSARHTSVTKVQDENGVVKYIYDGAMHDNPPKEVESFSLWKL